MNVAAAVLAKAACLDQSFSRPDPSVFAAWTEQLEVFDGPVQDALVAVRDHYRAETRRLMPADVLRLAEQIALDRRPALDRQEREAAREARAQATACCTMCDEEGYAGTTWCDHRPELEDITRRGMSLVSAVLDEAKAADVVLAR